VIPSVRAFFRLKVVQTPSVTGSLLYPSRGESEAHNKFGFRDSRVNNLGRSWALNVRPWLPKIVTGNPLRRIG